MVFSALRGVRSIIALARTLCFAVGTSDAVGTFSMQENALAGWFTTIEPKFTTGDVL